MAESYPGSYAYPRRPAAAPGSPNYLAPKPPAGPYQPNAAGMLHNAGTNQFGGAGVLKRADGTVTYTDGPPRAPVPGPLPGGPKTIEQWQANEDSRRMQTTPLGNQPQMVSTIGGGTPPNPMMKNLPSNPMQPAAPSSPGLNMFPGINVPTGMQKIAGSAEYNRRMDAMQRKQIDRIGGPGNLMQAIGMEGGLQQNTMNNQHAMQLGGMNNQHAMDKLRQEQSMQLHPGVKAQVDMLSGLLSNSKLEPEQQVGLLQHMTSLLGNGGMGGSSGHGAGGPATGGPTNGTLDFLKPKYTPFPQLGDDPKKNQALVQQHQQMQNGPVARGDLAKELSKQGKTFQAIQPPMSTYQAWQSAAQPPDPSIGTRLVNQYKNETDPTKKAQILSKLREHQSRASSQRGPQGWSGYFNPVINNPITGGIVDAGAHVGKALGF